MDADIWILTETHDDIDLSSSGHEAVRAQPRSSARQGEVWVTIWSRHPILDRVPVDDPDRTVAALVESPFGPLLVYGTVLPWHSDPGPNRDAKVWSEHHRVIPLQGSEWARLAERYSDARLCVAGDLNTNLGEPHYYGTRSGRALLREALEGAGLVCVTETDHVPPGRLRHAPIDHICPSAELASRATVVEAWEGTAPDGSRLSDHSGLLIEVSAKEAAKA